MRSSRTRPVIRESRVSKETVEAALNRLTSLSVSPQGATHVPHALTGTRCDGSGAAGQWPASALRVQIWAMGVLLVQSRALLTSSTDTRTIKNGIWKTQEKEPAPGVGP